MDTRHRHRQTDRQMDRWIPDPDTDTDRQTDRQTDRWIPDPGTGTDRQTES